MLVYLQKKTWIHSRCIKRKYRRRKFHECCEIFWVIESICENNLYNIIFRTKHTNELFLRCKSILAKSLILLSSIISHHILFFNRWVATHFWVAKICVLRKHFFNSSFLPSWVNLTSQLEQLRLSYLSHGAKVFFAIYSTFI